MTKTFSQTRKTNFSMDKLKAKINKNNDKKDDPRFYKVTADKAGNGEVTMRFLPGVLVTEDDLPYVEYFDHFYEGPGGYLIEICPNTIGELCPVCAANKPLYESGNAADKTIVTKRKKQHHRISNVYIVNDKNAPENNGKVFLFNYGPFIFDKIIERLSVQKGMDANGDEVELPVVEPFRIDANGADFVLQFHVEDEYRKYTKSRYKRPAPLDVSEEELNRILDAQLAFKEFVDLENKTVFGKKIKTTAELEKRLAIVLGGNVPKTIEEHEKNSVAAQEPKGLTAEERKSIEAVDPSASIDIDDQIRKLIQS